jgi:hypothetical protein
MTFQVTVDRARLQEVMRKYGVDNYTVSVDETFCTPLPHLARYRTRTITFRPLNWLCLLMGVFGRMDQWHATILAHEIRHACQFVDFEEEGVEIATSRLMNVYVLLRNGGYFWHPAEVDARDWASQNWREFRGIVTITRKPFFF